jgi:hypothetical protein
VRLITLLAILQACLAPRVQEFVDARTEALCARHERCGTLGENAWSSVEDCLAALDRSAVGREASGQDGCTDFDTEAAQDCLTAIDTASCDTSVDVSACDTVCADVATEP